jgi:hypothetical protein
VFTENQPVDIIAATYIHHLLMLNLILPQVHLPHCSLFSPQQWA